MHTRDFVHTERTELGAHSGAVGFGRSGAGWSTSTYTRASVRVPEFVHAVCIRAHDGQTDKRTAWLDHASGCVL